MKPPYYWMADKYWQSRARPLIVGKDFLTPEVEEQLKQPGYITVDQWLPPRASRNEPGPHVWRVLSWRSKLRDWSDWMPIQDGLEYLEPENRWVSYG